MTQSAFPRAVYAGSFDPITNGHLDVIRRVVDLFGGCSVLVAVNPEKTNWMFNGEERLMLIARAIIQSGINPRKVAVFNTSKFVADWVKDEGRYDLDDKPFLVRGIRHANELGFELGIAEYNKDRGVDTVILPASRGVAQVSSTALKRVVLLAAEGKDFTEADLLRMAPPAVIRAIQLKGIDKDATL